MDSDADRLPAQLSVRWAATSCDPSRGGVRARPTLAGVAGDRARVPDTSNDAPERVVSAAHRAGNVLGSRIARHEGPCTGTRRDRTVDDVLSCHGAQHASVIDDPSINIVTSAQKLPETVIQELESQFGDVSELLVSRSLGVPAGIADHVGEAYLVLDPFWSAEPAMCQVYRSHNYI